MNADVVAGVLPLPPGEGRGEGATPQLVRHFDLLAGAPQGVARLRELILSLAVRGKLVPQDPTDEPASVLLESIQNVGRVRRSRNPTSSGSGAPEMSGYAALTRPTIPDDEQPFEVSAGWEWVRITDISNISGGIQKTPARAPRQNHFPYLRVANVQRGYLILDQVERYELGPGELDRWRLEAGDLLIVEGNGSEHEIGRCAMWNGEIPDCVHQNHLIRVRPEPAALGTFLLLFLNSGFGRSEMKRLAITTSGLFSLSVGKIKSIAFPLPPLVEQSRIVAKVEELMALCDRLEAKGRLEAEQHGRLVATLFESLANDENVGRVRRSRNPTSGGSDVPEMSGYAALTRPTSWQRIATHFDLLLDRPEAVDALEQTLLQLAVRGLLVPQDSADEPAYRLLERIRSEKDRLITAGKVRRDKTLEAIAEDEKPCDLPEGWGWVRLQDISHSRLGKMLDKGKNSGHACPYLRNTNVQWWRFELDDVKDIFLEPHEQNEFRLLPGDLLVCEGGEPGRCAIWRDEGREMYFQKALHRVRPYCGVLPEYIQLCLRADAEAGTLDKYFTGATIKHFAGQELARYVLSLPPVAEQTRIVVRIEELRRLCADLRARLLAARATGGRLAEALVAECAS